MSATRRRRLSVAQWRELLGRFTLGKDTVAAFCAREGVCASSFYRWQGRLAGEVDQAPRAERKNHAASPASPRRAGFVDLGHLMQPVPHEPARAPAGLLLRLDLGDGVVLQISRP